MKKISLIILTILLLSQSGFAFAEFPATGAQTRTNLSTTSAARETIKTENQANLTANLRERAQREITRRITFLNELSAKLDKIKKLTASDKQILKTQIQSQIDGLNSLQAKINADTDLATLRTDVKSIINGYYIFAFFRVKIELLVAADRLSTASDNLNMIYTKLQTRISEAKSKGKDTVLLESELSDMLLKIKDAKNQYQAAETELSSLTPQGFPGNKSILLDARAKIKLGAQDLRNAYQDIAKIRQRLGEAEVNKIKNGTESANEKLTP